MSSLPWLAGNRFPLPWRRLPACSGLAQHYLSSLLGGWSRMGGESQWALMPWNWNSGQPRLPQVLISRGWPKGLGQEGREDFRGQYHPHTEEEEVFKVKPTGGWVNKLFVCPRTPAPLPLSLVPLSSLCVCVAPGMFLCLSLCSLSPFISSSWLGILERTSGRPEFKSLYHFLAV